VRIIGRKGQIEHGKGAIVVGISLHEREGDGNYVLITVKRACSYRCCHQGDESRPHSHMHALYPREIAPIWLADEQER
jgi:hypothetical protein